MEHEGRILLCRRAIEPCKGLWTVPAGFLEMGESTAAGAARETWEEANARVEVQISFQPASFDCCLLCTPAGFTSESRLLLTHTPAALHCKWYEAKAHTKVSGILACLSLLLGEQLHSDVLSTIPCMERYRSCCRLS